MLLPLTRLRTIAIAVCLAAGLFGCKESIHHDSAPPVTAAARSVTAPPAVAASAAPSAGTLADLSPTGLPVYPTVFESAWIGNFSTDKEAARVGQMSSHDSFDQVYAWYHEHMAAGTETPEAAASNHTSEEGDRLAMFQTGDTSEAKMSRVLLIRGKNDGYTTINLAAHVTK